MIYFFKSPYTFKLFNRLKINHPEIALIDIDSIDKVRPDDKLIIDAPDQIALTASHFKHENIIVMGESDTSTLYGKSISKYQSYKRIEALILDATYPITFLTHSTALNVDEDRLSYVCEKLDIEYRISLNYSPNSDFSLYNHLVEEDSPFERRKTRHVITCIKDYLNPPVEDLVDMIVRLKQKGSVLIYSSPLKGPLDNAVIQLSDAVVVMHGEGPEDELSALDHIVPPEKLKYIKHLDALIPNSDKEVLSKSVRI